MLSSVATHDTDPQTTEPGSPPDEAQDAENAAALIGNLAKAPLPAEDVRETEGHVAAAYAGAPHRPPRPTDKTVENAAVFVNATVPMSPPTPPDPMRTAPTVAGGRLLPTVASAAVRERDKRSIVIASVAGAVAAALLALVLVLAFTRAPSSLSSSSSTSAEPAPSPTPVPMMPPEPTTPVTAVAPTPTTTASPKPAPTSSTHTRPSAKPSATFAAPDRTF
jgi:hypothetical protein